MDYCGLITMTKFIFIMLVTILICTNQLANAQDQQQQDPTSSNFQPSLFVVIGVLSFMFSLTFALLMYAKFCHRQPSPIHNLAHQHHHTLGLRQLGNGMFGTSTRFSGIDKTVIESLPLFRFSSLKGLKQGLQCSVCLAEFGESEILRLLPKCKHGFHIECIDEWLMNHSTCPLCRHKISVQDLATCTINSSNSSSMRFILGGKTEETPRDHRQDVTVNTNIESSSIFELYLQREEHQEGPESSTGSFNQEENLPSDELEGRVLHRLNHQIVISDVVFKNRWSNVSSSDLMFLNSEMLGVMSSDRISYQPNLFDDIGIKYSISNSCYETDDHDHYRIINVKDEMERKRMFEHKVMSQLKGGLDDSRQMESMSSSPSPPRRSSSLLIPADKRSMSEITALSRFKDLMGMKKQLRKCLEESQTSVYDENDVTREEDIKRRRIWFPIAKRTVQWFVNREKNRTQEQQHQSQGSQHTLDV